MNKKKITFAVIGILITFSIVVNIIKHYVFLIKDVGLPELTFWTCLTLIMVMKGNKYFQWFMDIIQDAVHGGSK